MRNNSASRRADAAQTAKSACLCAFLLLPLLAPAADTPEKKSTPFGNTSITLKNYIRYPAFNAQGFRTHLIYGTQAQIHSTEQVDVNDLSFTQYPGDGSSIVVTRVTAPSATIRAYDKQSPVLGGKENVRLIYENELDASGDDWTYEHAQKKITIRHNARIAYTAPLKNIIGHSTLSTSNASQSKIENPKSKIEETVITSKALELTQDEASATTLAVFTGNVVITTSDGLRLTCDLLEVTASRLTDKNPELQPIDKFQRLIATGNVRVTQGARTGVCGRAEVLPREDKLILTQNAVVTDTELRITAAGDPVTLYRTERRIEGQNGSFTLPPWETPQKNEKNKTPPANTIITAANYVMWETPDGLTHIKLDNNVTVAATETSLACEHVELTVDPGKRTETPVVGTVATAATKIAPLQHLIATGNVRVTQASREATCGQAEVLPHEDKIILTQNPVLTDHATSSTAKAEIFTLQQLERRLTAENVTLTSPPLKDLSAKAKADAPKPATPIATPTTSPPTATPIPDIPTTITSRLLTMWTTPDEISHALFDHNVQLAATNLNLTCDHLAIDADPRKPLAQPQATQPQTAQPAAIKPAAKLEQATARVLSMVATGVVRFTQLEREVTCERAEIVPPEDRITLTGQPLIIDHERNQMITGKKLNLIRGRQDISGENVQYTGAPVKLP